MIKAWLAIWQPSNWGIVASGIQSWPVQRASWPQLPIVLWALVVRSGEPPNCSLVSDNEVQLHSVTKMKMSLNQGGQTATATQSHKQLVMPWSPCSLTMLYIGLPLNISWRLQVAQMQWHGQCWHALICHVTPILCQFASRYISKFWLLCIKPYMTQNMVTWETACPPQYLHSQSELARLMCSGFVQLNNAIYQDGRNALSLPYSLEWDFPPPSPQIQMAPILLLFKKAVRNWLFSQIFDDKDHLLHFIQSVVYAMFYLFFLLTGFIAIFCFNCWVTHSCWESIW